MSETNQNNSQNPQRDVKFLDKHGLSHFWHNAKDYIDYHDSLKIDKVTGAEGNIPVLDGTGNLEDTGMHLVSDSSSQDYATNPVTGSAVDEVVDALGDEVDELLEGKADKAVPSAAGNVPTLDAGGNLADSGYGIADDVADPVTHVIDYETFRENIPTGQAVEQVIDDKVSGEISGLNLADKIDFDNTPRYIKTLSQHAGQLDYTVGEMDDVPQTHSNAPVTSQGIHLKFHNIETLIPQAASSDNQLADKEYVDSLGERIEARYLGSDVNGNPFASYAAFVAAQQNDGFYYNGERVQPNNNDVIVVTSDETHLYPPGDEHGTPSTTRYHYQGDSDNGQWCFEYVINNSALNRDQLLAVNSGITPTKVQNYDAHLLDQNNPHHVTASQVGLGNVNNTADLDKPISTATQAALDTKVDKLTGTHQEGNIIVVGNSSDEIKDSGASIRSYYAPEDNWNPATGTAIKQAIQALDPITVDPNPSASTNNFVTSVELVEVIDPLDPDYKTDYLQVNRARPVIDNIEGLTDALAEITGDIGDIVAGKADKDADAVPGNIAEFDENGNPVDSGHALSEYKTKQGAITVNPESSTNSLTFLTSFEQNANGEITNASAATVPDASTSLKGVVQLTDSTSTTSSTLAATATAVKEAYDHASSLVESLDSTKNGTGTNVDVEVVEEAGLITSVSVIDRTPTAIANAIEALDSTVRTDESETGTAPSSNIDLTITQADGVLTGITINRDDSVNANDVANAISDAISDTVSALDSTVSTDPNTAATRNIDLTVTQENGVLTGITVDRDDSEDSHNKVSSFQVTPDDAHYPSEKLVKDSLDLKANKSEMTVTPGTGADTDKTTIQLKNGTAATVLVSHQDITGKADKVSGATDGNFAGLDSHGNLVDSGSKASDFKTIQSEVTDPSADGTGITFIDSITQNDNGVIAPHKKTVQSATSSQPGVMSAADKTKLDALPSNAELANLLAAKADKDTDAVDGNLASFDSNGNPVDSGASITSTYDAENSTDPVTGAAVSSAIADKADKVASAVDGNFAGLDVNGNLTDSGSKASDFATAGHEHGNITNDGKIGTTAGLSVVTTTDGEVTTADLTTADVSAAGTTLTAVTKVTQDSKGKISVEKKTIQDSTTSQKGVVQLSSATNSESETVAATSKAVKDVMDAVDGLSDDKADKVANATSGNFAGLDSEGNLTDSGSKASDFKTKQTAVSDPTASGNAISFIDTISQDTNGVITPTKKTVSLSSAVDSDAENAAATPKAVKLAYEHADSVVSDLDAEVPSSDGTNVQVKVTQANGKITGVNITTDNTENVNNKVSSFQTTPDDTHYPTEKLVKDSLDLKANKSEMTVTPGTGADADKTTIQLNTGTSATVLTAHQDITGKADKVSGATAGNLASLDANGNLVDSGVSYTGMQGEFKPKQTAQSDPTASGNALSFIATLSQDEDGVITATKKTVTVDSTYSSTGTNPVNGTAVAAAIGTLDVNNISGFGAGKTLATLTETDGKIAATFQDIEITKSQVSDFPTEMTPSSHTHGNITNDGKIGTTADLGIVTGTGGTVTAKDFTKASPTTGSGTTTEFISTVAQGSDGAISATKQAITQASTSVAGIVQLSSSTSSISETMAATPKAVSDLADTLGSGKADKVSGATSGNFAGLDSNGNLTDSGKKASDFATAAQGSKADTAIQGVKVNGTELTKDANNKVNVTAVTGVKGDAESDYRTGQVNITAGNVGAYTKTEVYTALSGKEDVANKAAQNLNSSSDTEYPSSAAVANFVNSSIATATANFLGTLSLTDLGLQYGATNAQISAALGTYTWPAGVTPTNNDYCFVSINNPSTTAVDEYRRFKFDGTDWKYEYTLNNSSFTQAQWNAINSGITLGKVTNYDDHLADTNNPHSVTAAQVGLGNVDNTADLDKPISTATQTALDGKVDKVTTATENHIAVFDNAGNIKDSGKTYADFQGEFKPKQTAKSSPTASGNALAFIDTVSQDVDGVITATKKTVTVDSTYSSTGTNPVNGTAVADAIGTLDSTKTSTDGTNVQVKVTETDGKITAVNITTDNTENRNNKVTSFQGTPDDTHYPSEKLVKDNLDLKANKSEMSITAVSGDSTKKNIQLKNGTSQNVLVAHQDISGKADTVPGAIAGNFAGLDANGNLTDSGKSYSDLESAFKPKQTAVTVSGLGTAKTITAMSQDADGVISVTTSGIRTATTGRTGIVQLDDTVTSTSTTLAATANAVKTAYDHADNIVAGLDAEITSTDGTNVQVKVTETDGKITAVNVTTDNTENKNNKVSSFQSTPDNTHYPSEKLVKDSLDAKVTGPSSATSDDIAVFDGTTGKLVKDGGKKISDVALSNAVVNYSDAIVKGTSNGGYWFKIAERTFNNLGSSMNAAWLTTISGTTTGLGTVETFVETQTKSNSTSGNDIVIAKVTSSPVSGSLKDISAFKNNIFRIVVNGTSGNATVELWYKPSANNVNIKIQEIMGGVSQPTTTNKNWTYTSHSGNTTGTTTAPTGTSYKDITWCFAKELQSEVSSPSASGTALEFIDTISQNANGEITATKKTVAYDNTPTAGSTNLVTSGGVQAAITGAEFISNANLGIPPFDDTLTNSGGVKEYVMSSGATNIPEGNYNWHLHATVLKYGSGSYRLTQIATGSNSSKPTIMYERSATSSNGTSWSFGTWKRYLNTDDVASTYSSTGTSPVNGTAVAAALGTLDVDSVGGAGKYISAISETDGKISATATTMDTTPTVNSTNAITSGAVQTALETKLNWMDGTFKRSANAGNGWAKIASMSRTWSSTNLSGIWDVIYLATDRAYRSTLELTIRFDSTDGAKAKRYNHIVTVDNSSLLKFAIYINGTNNTASTVELWAYLSNNWHGVGIREIGGDYYQPDNKPGWTYYNTSGGGGDKPTADVENNKQVVDFATTLLSNSGHTHGNITSAGALQTTDVSIASGDKLVITDSSDSNKVARSSTSFDGTTTTTALTPKGTFEAFAKAADITTAIQSLDVASAGGAGKYISAISEADGKISATATDMDTTPTASSTNAVTSGGVKTALDAKVNVASILLENQSTTLLSIVQSYAGTENKHYARWYTKSDGGTKLTDLPVSGKCFVCEAICSRWVSASDYVYQLTLWSKEDTNPYVAIVKQSTTAISWSRLNTQTITGVKGDAESSYRTGNVNLTPANLGISATSTSVTVGSTTFNQYVHPTTSGNKHVPSGGSSGQFLGWSADGTATWVSNPNTDTKVKATAKTDNVNYKILATASASPTSGNATEAVYDVDITLNPSTNTIAANISGNADTATKPAVTVLTESDDLNDAMGSTQGDVVWYRWASGHEPVNYPTTGTAEMEVVRVHSGNYCTQTVYVANNDTVYRRVNKNGTWGSWYAYSKSTHVHGQINNNGTITSTGVDLASGDRLAIVDSSDSSLVKKTNISFDGSTASKALTQKGTFESVMLAADAMSFATGNGLEIATSGTTATLSMNISAIPTATIASLIAGLS